MVPKPIPVLIYLTINIYLSEKKKKKKKRSEFGLLPSRKIFVILLSRRIPTQPNINQKGSLAFSGEKLMPNR